MGYSLNYFPLLRMVLNFMQKLTKKYIHIPKSDEVFPELWLSKKPEYIKDGNRVAISAVQYHKEMRLPTLAELRYAFFSKVEGNFVSSAYRKSIRSRPGYGEWTSTFLQNGKILIERPEDFYGLHNPRDIRVKNGKRTKIKLPEKGWVVEYDDTTGFPIGTSKNKEDAEKIFGDDASYFYPDSNGLRVVSIYYDLHNHGPFYINTHFGINVKHSKFGGRRCYNSKQEIHDYESNITELDGDMNKYPENIGYMALEKAKRMFDTVSKNLNTQNIMKSLQIFD